MPSRPHSTSPPQPKISVILCTYDRAKLLGRAIESVLEQTFADFELIVVDDGSTDGTSRLALGFAMRDPRVVYVRQTNRGLAAARNAGIALARGRWVTFLDSDDTYEADHLESRLALANRTSPDAIYDVAQGLRHAGDMAPTLR